MDLVKKFFKKNILWILITILFLLPRFIGLGFDQTNNDAVRWYQRTEGFLVALRSGDFEKTYQQYHPGVTLMIINAITRQFIYSYQYNFLDYKIDLYNPSFFPYFNGISKGVLILVIFSITLLHKFLIKKIWDNKTSWIYFFMLAIEPYFIGINRWFHLTSLEVMLMVASILFIFYYSQKKDLKLLALSGIFLGLAILTKVSALIIFPVLLFSILFNEKEEPARRKIGTIFLLAGSSILTIFILFPALWVNPVFTITIIKDAIFGAVEGDLRISNLDPKLEYVYYFLILIFKLSPITLFVFILSMWNYQKIKDKYLNLILISTLAYLIFLTFSSQKIDRYSITFFPFIILICARYLSLVSKRRLTTLAISSLSFLTIVSLFVYPNFSSYYSPILGGTKTALNLGVYENAGDFVAESAFYLNSKDPKPEIYVPNNYESFLMFYQGKSAREITPKTEYFLNILEMDRKNFDSPFCDQVIAEFGTLDTKVVSICTLKK